MGKVNKSIKPDEQSLTNPHTNTLYDTPDPNTNSQKISAILNKSNALLFESLGHNIDIHDLDQLTEATREYFAFCSQQGIMPSMRRLANWYGYSFQRLYQLIEKQSPEGRYLDQIRDAIKDNLEQAALVNAVNNISAMFIMKTQHGYVEATKVVLEPSDKLLGQPKTPEEIKDYIEADIVEE
jgi:hypothetical protein